MIINFSLKEVEKNLGKIDESQLQSLLKELKKLDDTPLSKEELDDYHKKISRLNEADLSKRFTI